MAKDQVKLEIVNEKSSEPDKHLDDEISMIFGKPVVPKPSPNSVLLLNTERDHDRHINGTSRGSDSDSEHQSLPSQPLLEPSRDKPLPPLAGPEIDDLDGDPPKDAVPYPGIDDGLLEPADTKPDIPDRDEGGSHDIGHESGDERRTVTNEDGAGTDGKSWDYDEPDNPYDLSGLSPRFGNDDRPISPAFGVTPDVNTYQQKKNLAQGMMDLALLSANANQLRYVLESSTAHPYYYPSITFISLSIIFQIAVGVGLIMNSRYDVNEHKDICKADKINNMTVIGIFLITIINVFITSFSVASPTAVAFPQTAQLPILQANTT